MWSACVLRRELGVCHDDGGELDSISSLRLRTRASYSIHLKYAEFQMTAYASMKNEASSTHVPVDEEGTLASRTASPSLK
jgi:hypothetical protein